MWTESEIKQSKERMFVDRETKDTGFRGVVN